MSESVRESTDYCLGKKQMSKKKPMKDTNNKKEATESWPSIETTSEISIKSQVPEAKGSEVCQIAEDVSRITKPSQVSTKPEVPEVPEESKNPEIGENMLKISAESEDGQLSKKCQAMSEDATSTKPEVPEESKNPEIREMGETMLKISAESEEYISLKAPGMSRTTSVESISTEPDVPEKPQDPEERQMIKNMSKMSTSDESKEVTSSRISTGPFEFHELEDSITGQKHRSTVSEISTSFQSENEVDLAKRFMDDNSEIFTKKLRASPIEEIKSLANNATNKIIFKEKRLTTQKLKSLAYWPSLAFNSFCKERPLVLATHRLVPSLPIELFEVLAEIIEVVAERPVILAHECRDLRPIFTKIVDIVVMQPDENWDHGVLLPASFVFEHHLNKDTLQPGIYVDVVVPHDRDSHIKDVMNLRGYKCAFPAKQSSLTAVGLLLRYLQLKGESIYYFGNISNTKTQLEALEMVINEEAQVAVLEAPVIKCHKARLRNIDSVDILASLGPLPPYRIMIKKTLADESNLVEDLTTYLLDIHENENWMERLMSFGIIGFCLNSQNMYDEARKKYPVLSKTYYY